MRRSLIFYLLLMLCFCVIEFWTSFSTNSSGLMTAALHTSFDVVAIMTTLYAMKQRKDKSLTLWYGYGRCRFEILAAFGNGILIILVCGFVAVENLHRLSDADVEVTTDGMVRGVHNICHSGMSFVERGCPATHSLLVDIGINAVRCTLRMPSTPPSPHKCAR